jgi:hypothetical protein
MGQWDAEGLSQPAQLYQKPRGGFEWFDQPALP